MLNEINVQSNLIVRDLNLRGSMMILQRKTLILFLMKYLKNSSLSMRLKKTELFDNEVNSNDNIKTIIQKVLKINFSVTLDINMVN